MPRPRHSAFLQVHLSGGELGARRDLVAILAAAHAAGLYTNLITSAVGIAADTLRQLSEAGLAAAIGKALSMPLAERRERHDALFRVLSHNDIQRLSDRLLAVSRRL